MSEYTPSRDLVRQAWEFWSVHTHLSIYHGIEHPQLGFDRWLAGVERAAAEKALLEAATAVETGWEYGTAHREDPQVGAVEWSRARAEERVREWNEATQSVTGFVVRRRPAGPWVPVEGESA